MPDTTLGSAGTRHRSVPERLRAEAYLTRLEWHLEAVMPARERRSTVEELRRTLDGDPRDMTTSLRDLGSPRALAEQYAGDGRQRPLWSIGIITAGSALLVYWTVFTSFALGMLAAVESGTADEAEASFLTIGVIAYSTVDAVGIGWTSDWAWLAVPTVVAAVALLLGARSWRAIGPDDEADRRGISDGDVR